jgi:hypothetical protein
MSNTELVGGLKLYFAAVEGPALATERDALDLLGETYGQEIDMIVVPVQRFPPSFFDLSTKQAGHFFQKLQNYRTRLAIMGDISDHVSRSKALIDFVGETNRIGHHMFVADRTALSGRLGHKA